MSCLSESFSVQIPIMDNNLILYPNSNLEHGIRYAVVRRAIFLYRMIRRLRGTDDVHSVRECMTCACLMAHVSLVVIPDAKRSHEHNY